MLRGLMRNLSLIKGGWLGKANKRPPHQHRIQKRSGPGPVKPASKGQGARQALRRARLFSLPTKGDRPRPWMRHLSRSGRPRHSSAQDRERARSRSEGAWSGFWTAVLRESKGRPSWMPMAFYFKLKRTYYNEI